MPTPELHAVKTKRAPPWKWQPLTCPSAASLLALSFAEKDSPVTKIIQSDAPIHVNKEPNFVPRSIYSKDMD